MVAMVVCYSDELFSLAGALIENGSESLIGIVCPSDPVGKINQDRFLFPLTMYISEVPLKE